MSELLQIATLVSAILGWITVIVGGLSVWQKLREQIIGLQGKLDNLCNDYNQLRRERAECEEREKLVVNDHEARLRILEKDTHASS